MGLSEFPDALSPVILNFGGLSAKRALAVNFL
jgi:hypothetical protein